MTPEDAAPRDAARRDAAARSAAAGGSRILVVCSANVCRSPMAELTLRRAFANGPAGLDIEVASAGVRAEVDSAVCPDVRSFDGAADWQQLCARHRPRPLTARDIAGASLVLAASRSLRSSVVAVAPEHRHRVFTLREAVWLGTGFVHDSGRDGPDAVSAFWQHIDSGRGLRPLPPPARRPMWGRRPHDPLDIADGHTSSAAAHRETVQLVDRTARDLAALIAPVVAIR